MPLTPTNYSNTIIYKIVCKDLSVTDVYVGHTTDFKSRKSRHKSNCNDTKNKNKCYNLKVYEFIRANGGWNNFDMIEIEKYTECKDSNEARTRERYWYEILNAKLNMRFPQRTHEELKECDKINSKIYREKHKEEIKEHRKEYHKLYNEEHKEYKKQYRTNRNNTPYTCECGWIGNDNSKWFHINISLKHKNYLENQT
jgi:hypothetical protein